MHTSHGRQPGLLWLIVAASLLAGLVPPYWTGNWHAHIVRNQPHFGDRFFAMDAQWYQRIADYGYAWEPAAADQKQSVAFFPLWPIILRLAAVCTASLAQANWAAIAASAVFATASICACEWLATRLLPARGAALATVLFALHPIDAGYHVV